MGCRRFVSAPRWLPPVRSEGRDASRSRRTRRLTTSPPKTERTSGFGVGRACGPSADGGPSKDERCSKAGLATRARRAGLSARGHRSHRRGRVERERGTSTRALDLELCEPSRGARSARVWVFARYGGGRGSGNGKVLSHRAPPRGRGLGAPVAPARSSPGAALTRRRESPPSSGARSERE